MAEEKNSISARETTDAPPLSSLLERILDETAGDGPTSDTPPRDATADTPPLGNSPLGMLFQNPALLSAMPSLLENLSPLLGSLGGVGSAHTATRPHPMDRHTALLCALKPYLSPHRQDTAEMVIRLCRVWDALEKSGVSLTGLLGSVGNISPRGEGRDEGVQ